MVFPFHYTIFFSDTSSSLTTCPPGFAGKNFVDSDYISSPAKSMFCSKPGIPLAFGEFHTGLLIFNPYRGFPLFTSSTQFPNFFALCTG
jgi:hypothetical protein